MTTFTSRWGHLQQLQLPLPMFVEKVLILPPAELRVLIALLYMHKAQARQRGPEVSIASVKVTQLKLMRRTGIRSQTSMSMALHGLQEAGFIEIVWDNTGSNKRGEMSSEYILTDPETREPLPVIYRRGNVLGALGLRYFSISECLLTSAAYWSLANLSGSEVKLYVAMLWLANLKQAHGFEHTHADMYHAAHLTLVTYRKALDGLQARGLIFVVENEEAKACAVQICDPFTGEPMHVPDGYDRNDPAYYTIPNASGKAKRFPLNGGTEAELEQVLRDAVPAADPVIKLSNGELKIRCPFHDDSKPSCSVSVRKRCYRCWVCPLPDSAGTFRKLIGKLTGQPMAGTVERIAHGRGMQVQYREPKSAAIAVYNYCDAAGQLLKQVRRFPNDEEGNKHISQRRPTENGWIPDVKGIGPLLYNAHLLATAGTVVIVEGEKDADTVTRLHLSGHGGVTIAVTSGGKGSWHPRLAKQLRGKVVIVMPDNDPAGEDYAVAIRAALSTQNIEYKSVSFAGTGAKDVTEYLQSDHSAEDLVNLIDSDWVTMPEASHPGMPINDEVFEA
jgi:5S rRNA maturation endonuclease (ribonuclease M5)